MRLTFIHVFFISVKCVCINIYCKREMYDIYIYQCCFLGLSMFHEFMNTWKGIKGFLNISEMMLDSNCKK